MFRHSHPISGPINTDSLTQRDRASHATKPSQRHISPGPTICSRPWAVDLDNITVHSADTNAYPTDRSSTSINTNNANTSQPQHNTTTLPTTPTRTNPNVTPTPTPSATNPNAAPTPERRRRHQKNTRRSIKPRESPFPPVSLQLPPVAWYHRVFAENNVGLGFLSSVSHIKSIPTHEKMVAVGRSGPDATFSLIFYWAGLDLGWGVRRFHDSICMFCNPTEFRKSQHPSRGSTFWPHSSAPTAGRPLNRITTRCRCWRVISVTQYTQRRLLLLRCGYCYCCMATAVIAAVWGGRP